MGSLSPPKYDVIVIGAGLSGLSMLYNIRKRLPSWTIRVLEVASDVGGTWYWNRYPGARFDSESITYQLTWDKELLQEWNWVESFAPQEETLRYINRFADKNDLRKDIQFATSIVSAQWQNDTRCWMLTDSEGIVYQGRFLVSCLGVLSNPTLPNIPGIQNFEGNAYHTSRFPKDFVLDRDLSGKRVGVIGTGATGIQTITAVAREPKIKSLTVFQRTATWAAPLHNTRISAEQMGKIKNDYDSIFQRCAATPSCFLHKPDPRKSADVSAEERFVLWEKLYHQPGFGKWLGTFSDTYTDLEANRLYSDYMADKIRARVNDPKLAEKLIPKTHGFGTRRVPLESGFYESFNQAHVQLVDINESPITDVEGKRIFTSDGHDHEVDVLIFATGFDAITGSFSRIDWTSKSGRPLLGTSATHKVNENGSNPLWPNGRPVTAMGLMTHDMPNMFMVLGPHQPFGNIPRSIEHAVEVIMSMLERCDARGHTYIEPTMEACEKWAETIIRVAQGQLANEVDSWMTGVNTNVPGKSERFIARYCGSAVEYRAWCEEDKGQNWPLHIFK